jgi:hypothetical protein
LGLQGTCMAVSKARRIGQVRGLARRTNRQQTTWPGAVYASMPRNSPIPENVQAHLDRDQGGRASSDGSRDVVEAKVLSEGACSHACWNGRCSFWGLRCHNHITCTCSSTVTHGSAERKGAHECLWHTAACFCRGRGKRSAHLVVLTSSQAPSAGSASDGTVQPGSSPFKKQFCITKPSVRTGSARAAHKACCCGSRWDAFRRGNDSRDGHPRLGRVGCLLVKHRCTV